MGAAEFVAAELMGRLCRMTCGLCCAGAGVRAVLGGTDQLHWRLVSAYPTLAEVVVVCRHACGVGCGGVV